MTRRMARKLVRVKATHRLDTRPEPFAEHERLGSGFLRGATTTPAATQSTTFGTQDQRTLSHAIGSRASRTPPGSALRWKWLDAGESIKNIKLMDRLPQLWQLRRTR